MPGRPPETGDKEEINLGGRGPSAMEEMARPPDPPSPQPTPLPDDDHFQPDRRTSRMMADEELLPPPSMFADSNGEVFEDEQEMDVADLFGDFDHDDPNGSAMHDNVTGPNDMPSALIGAGTDAVAATQFVDRIFGVQHATTFMEVYGQGSLVTEATNKRRSLNLRGLNAFDLRTLEADGTPWNFNDRADTRLAQKMIDEDDPDWIVGSPPCTAFSTWNRQMNYRKMDPKKVRLQLRKASGTSAVVVSFIGDNSLEASTSFTSTRLEPSLGNIHRLPASSSFRLCIGPLRTIACMASRLRLQPTGLQPQR